MVDFKKMLKEKQSKATKAEVGPKAQRVAGSQLAVVESTAQTLAPLLEKVIESIPNAPTLGLAMTGHALAPILKQFTGVVEAAKGELKKRASEGHKDFIREENNLVVDLPDGERVTVQERSGRVEEREGALKWLAKNKPAVYSSSTREVVEVESAKKLVEALTKAKEMGEAISEGEEEYTRRQLEDAIVELGELLEASVSYTVVLDQKLVEKAVKEGDLSPKEVEKYLYTTGDTTYAVYLDTQPNAAKGKA